MKFIELPLAKLRAVPDAQLRELAELMEKRFPAGAIACGAELDSRRGGDSTPPHLLLITGSPSSADDFRNLFHVGGILESLPQSSGVKAAIRCVDEMILCVRAAMEESDDRRAFFKLQMGLAF
jgi:hypothetical protein